MKHVYGAFLLILLSLSASAQRFTVENTTAFRTFVQQIERDSKLRFFFRSADIDSVTVGACSDCPVAQILESSLRQQGLQYAIDENKIYITKERSIMTSLPINFFGEGPALARRDTSTFDFSEYERKELLRKQVEQKIFHIGNRNDNTPGAATIIGNIRDSKTGELLVGASIYEKQTKTGVATDQYGYYVINLPKGQHELMFQSVGMKTTRRQVVLHSNGRLDVELDQDVTPLKEVTIESDRDVLVRGLQMGMEKLDIKTMRQIPLALVETDIFKVVLTLPGVQSVGEGTVGLNVRGGSASQNMILLNDAILYNPSHLFGFFSTFNPDVLKNVELYKSGITADYGGRLSSVLDVHTREGNQKKLSGSGGISPITARFTLEGPIVKDETTFIIGGRTTYSNWLLRQLEDKNLQQSKASFYDVIGNVSHTIDEKNTLLLSGYMSHDNFRLGADTTYRYTDRNGNVKWKHIFNNKFYSVVTAGFSDFEYSIESARNPVNAYNLAFDIRQLNAKADINYFPNPKHNITGGISAIRYDVSPGTFTKVGEASLITEERLAREKGVETAMYVGDNYELNERTAIYAGLRFSMYSRIGPGTTFTYTPGLPLEQNSITDTVSYASGSAMATYSGLEPRVSIRHSLSNTASVKVSYNRMRQYIQVLSNTVAINPTDIWKLSDRYVKPQIGDQFSAGYYQYLKNNTIEMSVEGYYKTIKNTVDFKSGASLFLNQSIETELINASGKAYGGELMVKRNAGKLNGWVSYTYSRTLLRTLSSFADEQINRGSYYPANYDKPHTLNFISNYKFSRRFNTSFNFIYSTGRPITVPVAMFDIDGVKRVYYGDRNQARIPDYIRCDISVNVEGNHKVRKLAHSSWTFAVYNLLGRKNAYSVFFTNDNGKINAYQLAIFGRPIPTVTYNFKF